MLLQSIFGVLLHKPASAVVAPTVTPQVARPFAGLSAPSVAAIFRRDAFSVSSLPAGPGAETAATDGVMSIS